MSAVPADLILGALLPPALHKTNFFDRLKGTPQMRSPFFYHGLSHVRPAALSSAPCPSEGTTVTRSPK